jgi:hypothetical protein
MRRWIFTASALIGTTALVLACGIGTDCDFGLCEGPTVGSPEGGEGSADGDGPDVVTPPGCDPVAEPTSSPLCVVTGFGVFVAAGGTGDGSKESPLGSIQKGIDLALTKGLSRVYVCKGDYRENIKLSSAISLFGGFSCSWEKADDHPRVAPDTGYALEIRSVSTTSQAALVVADIEFAAAAATSPGESSISVFVNGSSDIVLRRLKVSAAAGKSGNDGPQFTSNLFVGSLTGNPGITTAGALKKDCACVSYGMSTGGTGGNGGTAVSVDGKVGGIGGASPILPTLTAPFDGHGGAGATNPAGSCANGGFGQVGAPRTGGVGAKGLGTISTNGWIPTSGGDGEAGNPGQGGGGGGGDCLAGGGGGGGGGGCGGCGGAGGRAGQGGGGSIALLAMNSSIRLDRTELRAAGGGKAGNGSVAEAAAGGGGGGGGGIVGACGGREGGAGAGGGGGGGGAGGASFGIAFLGKAPVVDGSPVSTAKTHDAVKELGAPGGRGLRGAGGPARLGGALDGIAGADGLDGDPGEAFAIWQAP